MTADSKDNIFDESNFISAFTCALLMSSIDGKVHDKEWAVILRFINAHWKSDYQDFKKIKVEIEKKIAPYLIESVAFQGMISDFVDNLTKKMTDAQKTILLKLVGDIMVADGIMKSEEKALFETFKVKLRIEKG